MLKQIFFLLLIGGIAYFGFQNRGLIQGLLTEDHGDVVVLSETNFDEVVKANEFVLVKFYAPWCGHCKKMAPEYSSAASTLKSTNSTIVLAKVDVTENRPLGERYDIKGFPTLKWFTNGTPSDYEGGRTSAEILRWVSRKTGNFSTQISTEQQLNDFLTANKVAVLFFSAQTEGSAYEVFKTVGINEEKVSFGQVVNTELAALKNTSEGKIVLFKQFDENRVDFTQELTVENLNTFISSNKVPSVLEFDDDAIEVVFQSKLSTFFIFHDQSAEGVKGREIFDKLATELKGKIVFAYTRPTDASGHFNKLGEFVGVNLDKLPAFAIIDTSKKLDKYIYSGEVTEEALKQYITSFTNGTLEKTLKTEEIPEKNDEAVKVIVGKSFQSLVLDTTQDVLVKFYAPWCGHCKSLAPHYDEAAEKLLVNKNIMIGKVDSTKNEVAGVEIEGFPTLKFFPGNNKANVIDFTGQRTADGIINWIKENTTHEWVDLESQGEQKQETKEDKTDL